jgi:hypothetical protein
VPKVVPTVAEQSAVKQARQVYEGALASAVRDYTKAGNDAEAAEVQSQWDDLQLVTYGWQTKVEGIDEVWSFGRRTGIATDVGAFKRTLRLRLYEGSPRPQDLGEPQPLGALCRSWRFNGVCTCGGSHDTECRATLTGT